MQQKLSRVKHTEKILNKMNREIYWHLSYVYKFITWDSDTAIIIYWILFSLTWGGNWRESLTFPGGSNSKESACNVGDRGLIPGSGRSPREGNGNPLQYSCLENSMDGEVWHSMRSQRVGHDWETNTWHFHSLWKPYIILLFLQFPVYYSLFTAPAVISSLVIHLLIETLCSPSLLSKRNKSIILLGRLVK